MDNQTRIFHFLSETGILPLEDDSEGVLIGDTFPHFSPEGVERVMQAHVDEIDKFRAKLTTGSLKELELFLTRGFTFQEYDALFDLSIKEKDFAMHPAFRSLWITSEAVRRKYIYKKQKQNYNDYLHLLQKCLTQYNPSLLTFFFRTNYSSAFSI